MVLNTNTSCGDCPWLKTAPQHPDVDLSQSDVQGAAKKT